MLVHVKHAKRTGAIHLKRRPKKWGRGRSGAMEGALEPSDGPLPANEAKAHLVNRHFDQMFEEELGMISAWELVVQSPWAYAHINPDIRSEEEWKTLVLGARIVHTDTNRKERLWIERGI